MERRKERRHVQRSMGRKERRNVQRPMGRKERRPVQRPMGKKKWPHELRNGSSPRGAAN